MHSGNDLTVLEVLGAYSDAGTEAVSVGRISKHRMYLAPWLL